MQIIKKNGSLQDFDKAKLERTITAASDSILQRMNSSDASFLAEKVEEKINSIRADKTSSFEIFAIVLYVLKSEGFAPVADSYYNGA